MEHQSDLTSDVINELISLKTTIDTENSKIIEERARLLNDLKQIQMAKDQARRLNADTLQRITIAQLDNKDIKRQVERLARHLKWQDETKNRWHMETFDELTMAVFAHEIEKLRAAIEGAVHYFNEESLQLVLVEKNNINRDIRVELTRIVNEIETLKKDIEEKRQEKLEQERQEQLKQEQARLEQEKLERCGLEQQRLKQQRLEGQKFDPMRQEIPIRTPPPKAALDSWSQMARFFTSDSIPAVLRGS